MALIEKLNAIGDAIRAKTGGTEKLTLDQMPTEIASITTGGEGLPDDALVLTGNQDYAFAQTAWNWFIEKYGSQIVTRNITTAQYMFAYNPLETIPFEINLAGSTNSMFEYSRIKIAPKLTGTIGNSTLQNVNGMFQGCYYLREIPEPDLVKDYISYSCGSNFQSCYSLREVPAGLMKMLTGNGRYNFYHCYSLNEVVNFPVYPSTQPASLSDFEECHRLARLTFETNEDGSPKVVDYWTKGMYIDLTNYIGYAKDVSEILNYNSGITADKEVTDLTSYNALKNDPDWFTVNIAYSRYNKTSAVETINSLPDVSACADGSHIKFKGDAGSLTDGGAINTMTEEQIAVAAARGWTVTLV